MTHLTSASFLALITCPGVFHLTFSSEVFWTAFTGHDAILPCQNKNGAPVIVVEWTRPDLKPSEYVYFYRDERSESINQHPSFKNRVELRDGEIKNGDLSLTLKNLTKNDSGTYECRCLTDGARRRKRAMISSEPISIINLKVVDPARMDPQSMNEPVMAQSVMNKDSTDDHDSSGPAGRGRAAVAVVATLLIAVVFVVVVVSVRVKTKNTTRSKT